MDIWLRAEQIRTIQISRFVGYHGRVEKDAVEREEAIKITLAQK